MTKYYNIAFIIPSSTKKLRLLDINEDLPLIKWLLPSLEANLTDDERKHNIEFYIGFDTDDKFYSDEKNRNYIISIFKEKNYIVNFIPFENHQNSPVQIWNELYRITYDKNFDFFYQLGDDIEFKTPFLNTFIQTLIDNRGGIVGAGNSLITQAFIDRSHMDIFGFLYPEEFINYHSDNWLQMVYGNRAIKKPDIIIADKCRKMGPRYKIDMRYSGSTAGGPELLQTVVDKYKNILKNYE